MPFTLEPLFCFARNHSGSNKDYDNDDPHQQQPQNHHYHHHHHQEILRDGQTQRLPVAVGMGRSISIGRNAITGIADDSIRRREYAVEERPIGTSNQTVWVLHKIKREVWINNGEERLIAGEQRILHAGDTVAMTGNRYAYRVVPLQGGRSQEHLYTINQYLSTSRTTHQHVEDDFGPDSPTSASSPFGSSLASALPPNALEELYCPVCLEIMAQSVTLIPCGHTFCNSCVRTECPTCRATCPNRVTCRSLNNLIATWVQLPPDISPFPPDDVAFYQQRIQTEQAPATSRVKGEGQDWRKRLRKRLRSGWCHEEAICVD